MILPIVMWPNPRLTLPSREVLSLDQKVPNTEHPLTLVQEMTVEELIPAMRETMVAAGGVGLSAIQVGVPLNIVVTVFPGLETLINLNLEKVPGEILKPVKEGCLSLPGFTETVPRYEQVRVFYRTWEQLALNPGADKVHSDPYSSQYVHGLVAQCLSHEWEHINGKFFLDHVGAGRRDQIRSQLRRR